MTEPKVTAPSTSAAQAEIQKSGGNVNVPWTHAETDETSPFDSPEYCKRLITYTRAAAKSDFTLLKFASLQRLNLIHLQNELALLKADIVGCHKTSKPDVENLKGLIHDYATAIRDFDYLSRLPRVQDPQSVLDKRILLTNAFPDLANRPGAPYDSACLTLRRDAARDADAVREILRKHLHRRLAWSAEERAANRLGYSQRQPSLLYLPLLDWLARFLIAIGGGCLVVVPMVIMSFGSSQPNVW